MTRYFLAKRNRRNARPLNEEAISMTNKIFRVTRGNNRGQLRRNETGQFSNIWDTFLNKTKYRDKRKLQSFSETLYIYSSYKIQCPVNICNKIKTKTKTAAAIFSKIKTKFQVSFLNRFGV